MRSLAVVGSDPDPLKRATTNFYQDATMQLKDYQVRLLHQMKQFLDLLAAEQAAGRLLPENGAQGTVAKAG
jgi:hypothetical protein